MPTSGSAFVPASVGVAELAGVVSRPGFDRWRQMVYATGGCAQPVHLEGESILVHRRTGEILDHYTTASEPGGRLLIACGNRRVSRCPACARVYAADTFHLIRAGLCGGKGCPESVRAHPRVFATFTAPSFGPVHARRVDKRTGRVLPCHPRRSGPSCLARHAEDDPLLGQPLDPHTYDYVGAVLWNAHAGELWRRFTIYLRRELAKAAGLTVKAFTEQARVSYAKVAEFQLRGLVHFHAVIRLDGPAGAADSPPAWATVELLERAIRAAVQAVTVRVPGPGGGSVRMLAWGEQLELHPITTAAFDNAEAITEEAVAGYVAKYATKAAEAAGTLDRPIRPGDLTGGFIDPDRLPPGVTDHALRMIATCWGLGELPEYAHLRLRKWAHMLGFRGHFATKSRTYSTTLTALRAERKAHRVAEYRAARGLPLPDGDGDGDEREGSTLVLAHWRFAGQGYTPGESLIAQAIWTELQQRRTRGREAA
ncbi:hypothetical protein LI90_617 [Carbonactinospora thermoautotrophica]|uniref:Replication initiation protein n=1 Tax=Carbonactinospora thermoautotrophica TaxID=1469144 RepID=A0A132MMA3_9ACTN|nr:replication initiator [Carbonactinospora thermoautotrophica]KWW98987.1 hypothetical protein LI90_617 [Carbonactinospora thermoautotrophica]